MLLLLLPTAPSRACTHTRPRPPAPPPLPPPRWQVRGGYYTPAAYLISKLTLDAVLLRVLPSVLYWAPFYYMAGFQAASAQAGERGRGGATRCAANASPTSLSSWQWARTSCACLRSRSAASPPPSKLSSSLVAAATVVQSSNALQQVCVCEGGGEGCEGGGQGSESSSQGLARAHTDTHTQHHC